MISREKLCDALLTAVLTRKCRFCGRVIDKDKFVCEECEAELSVITGERCKHCGAEKKRCGCKGHRMRYDGIVAPYYYEGSAKTSLLLLKFSEKEYMAYTLAQDMADTVKKEYGDINFDFIAYVPFTTYQKLYRTYNQSELLAYHLGRFLKLPVKNVLVKLFDTEAQHTLGKRDRTGNVIGIYDVKNNVGISGATVLLADDIKTTGATLNECARMLKIHGAEKVYCITAALSGEKPRENNTVEIK